jgi:hypothetical protein
MKMLIKLFAVAMLPVLFGATATAQFLPPVRPALPLPPGVRSVPTSPPSFSPVYPLQPGWSYQYTPRPYPPVVIDIDYKVYYRTCPRSPWQYYGRAETLREARYLERRLEADGYQVELVEKFDSGYDHSNRR